MDTDEELFLDMIDDVVLTVLDRIGDDPQARFEFFRRLLAVAREAAGDHGRQPSRKADP